MVMQAANLQVFNPSSIIHLRPELRIPVRRQDLLLARAHLSAGGGHSVRGSSQGSRQRHLAVRVPTAGETEAHRQWLSCCTGIGQVAYKILKVL